jgi:hypothetical protein
LGRTSTRLPPHLPHLSACAFVAAKASNSTAQ